MNWHRAVRRVPFNRNCNDHKETLPYIKNLCRPLHSIGRPYMIGTLSHNKRAHNQLSHSSPLYSFFLLSYDLFFCLSFFLAFTHSFFVPSLVFKPFLKSVYQPFLYFTFFFFQASVSLYHMLLAYQILATPRQRTGTASIRQTSTPPPPPLICIFQKQKIYKNHKLAKQVGLTASVCPETYRDYPRPSSL